MKQDTKPGSAILSIARDAASSDGKMYTHSVSVLSRLARTRPEVVDFCAGGSNPASMYDVHSGTLGAMSATAVDVNPPFATSQPEPSSRTLTSALWAIVTS